jgi:excisionase family DNA binding protein
MSHPNGQRLDSWKEIAAYLGRDLRTVRRWEEEKGLPVYRVPGGERRAVFAYRAEIDSWLTGQADNGSAGTGSEEGVAGTPDESSKTAVATLSLTTDSLNRPKVRPSPWKRWLLVAAVCGLAVAAWLLWRGAYGGPVARVDFSDDMLVARNKRGSILWAMPLDRALDTRPEVRAGKIAIVDLGQDRRGDILVAAPFSSPDANRSASDTLYCFSPQGKLRWRHIFDSSFRFGGHEYGSPWDANPPVVISDGAKLSIWAAAIETFWSPSTLTEFDADGHQLAQFVNWGHIMVLNHVRNASGSYILAGGISNQCDCAMLAVLNEEDASGSSPAQDPAYACENCPQGKPVRYILFPRSELTQLSGATYNKLRLINADGAHVWVGVSETYDTEVPGSDWIKYELTEDFVPKSFTVSDHFWTFHRQMEAEGKIHHTVEQCPERTQPRRVQVWSPEDGWKQITVPASTER